MPPEISKLVAAVTQLVSALSEKAGLPDNLSSPIGATSVSDDRFTAGKERVAAARGLLVRFGEPTSGDRSWIKIANIFADSFAKKIKKPDFDYEEETETVPFIIENIMPSTGEEKDEKGIVAKILEVLGPVLLIIGGIGASIAAAFTGPGVVGNTLNLIGKLMVQRGGAFIARIGNMLSKLGDDFIKGLGKLTQSGLKLIGAGTGSLAKTLGGIAAKVGGFLLKAAKFLPFIGSAVSFYFAYKRFQEGDYVGMGLEIVSGLLNLIPGVGWIASAIVDVINITRDFKTTKEERAEQSGFIGKMFTGIKDWFAKNGMAILKTIPFIGSLIYFWDAYKAGFTTPEGIKNTIKAFGALTGLGIILSPAIDFVFGLFEEKEEGAEQGSSQGSSIGKMFTGIKDWFVKNGITILKNIPFIGSLIYLWDAYKAGFTTPEGIKNVIKAYGMLTGLGIILSPAIDFVFGLFEEKEESETGSTATRKPFWQNVKEYMKRSLSKLPWVLRKPLEWLGIIEKEGSESTSWMGSSLSSAQNTEETKTEVENPQSSLNSVQNVKEVKAEVLDNVKALGSAVKDWFADSITAAKDTGKEIVEETLAFGSFIKNWFAGSILATNVLKTLAFGSSIINWFDGSISAAKDIGKEIVEKTLAFGSFIKNWFEDSISAAIDKNKTSAFGSSIINWFDSGISAAIDIGKEIVEKTFAFGSYIINWFDSSISATNAFKTVAFGLSIINWFDGGVSAAKDIGKKIQEKTLEFGSSIINWFEDSINAAKNIDKSALEKIGPIVDNILNSSSLRSPLLNNSAIAIQIANEAIRIESNVLVEIAQQSKNQTILLQRIMEKMDTISFGPGPSAPAPAAPSNTIPGMEKGGSISSNLSREALLPINTVGGLA